MNKQNTPEGQVLQITVLIAGRPYPLRVQAADEALMHRLVNDINDRVSTFQAQYPGKDKQDCLAMTLLSTLVEQFRLRQQDTTDEKVARRLRSIEETLDKMI